MAKPKGALKRPRPGKRVVVAAPEPMLGAAADVSQSAPTTPEDALIRLQALADALVKTRDEAVTGRQNSGIEDIWREDDEHYEGIDDLNRNITTTTNQSKPPGQMVANVARDQATEFVNITRPYTDAAAAKTGDILIPTDDKGWTIKPTPIPELQEKADGNLPIEVIEGMASANLPEQTAVQVAQTEQQAAQAQLAEAQDKAERAEKRIEDWQIEGQYHAELRKVIDTSARLGTGVLKGPVPERKRQQMFKDNALVIEMVTKPVSKEVDPWNCFPDPSCGSSIHNGRYHWERDYLTPKQLQALKGGEGYIDSQIDLCLEEGPQKTRDQRQTSDGRNMDDKGLFQIWYFYGYAKQEDMEAAGCTCPANAPALIPAIFTLVNERVIKGALNPLDTGEFPYDYFPWSPRRNSPWGFGIPRQIRTAQRIVVAATRVLMTNAGRAAGPIILMRRKVLGADGNNNIYPWKVFYAPETDNAGDVADLLKVYELPDRRESLMAIIQYGLKLAEDTTGLPLLLQGQQTANAPDTLGGQLLVDRNASTVLRRIARTFDDRITEPHVRRYYTYLLLYGEDDFEKGEFVIDARGSTALVEREINREEAEVMLKASLDPRFGVDPKKAMKEKLRADKRNPQDYLYSPEDQKKIDALQQQQRQMGAPAVQAAQVTAQSREKIAAAEIQAEHTEKGLDRQLALIVQQTLQHIEGMKLTGEQEQTFATIKAELAGLAMKLNTQKGLATQDAAVALHKHETPPASHIVTTPPTEPPGRAQPGHAYQQ